MSHWIWSSRWQCPILFCTRHLFMIWKFLLQRSSNWKFLLQSSYSWNFGYKDHLIESLYYRGHIIENFYYKGHIIESFYYRGHLIESFYYRGHIIESFYSRCHIIESLYYLPPIQVFSIKVFIYPIYKWWRRGVNFPVIIDSHKQVCCFLQIHRVPPPIKLTTTI
jgi:hypothetical protein